MVDRASPLWAVVLAGGEGTRLASLTRALYGTDRPKQFAVLSGSRSMVQETVDRILPLIPAERVVVVASRQHEALAREQLAEWSAKIELLVQPRNLDTGAGLILPLAWLRARDPTARVVVLPSDHHVARPEVLRAAIARAAEAARIDEGLVSLLGAEPDGPDTDYGWIVPGRPLQSFGRYEVLRFVEKPDPALARALLSQGALWNTFIMVGAVEALWQLARRHLPAHADLLSRCSSPRDLEQAYATLGPASFSHGVLERAENLALLPLRGAGWCDWGRPGRVLGSLVGTPDHQRLLQCIGLGNPRAVA